MKKQFITAYLIAYPEATEWGPSRLARAIESVCGVKISREWTRTVQFAYLYDQYFNKA